MGLKDVAHREVRETLHVVRETMQHTRPHCNKLSPLRLTAGLKEFCIHSKVPCIHSQDIPTLKADSSTQRCRTLQHTATHCSTLQHNAAHCNTLQHTATHCNTLQHTATHCNTLQHTTAVLKDVAHCNTLHHTAPRCNTIQHTATHCNTLQHTATHCNTPQHKTALLNDVTLLVHEKLRVYVSWRS